MEAEYGDDDFDNSLSCAKSHSRRIGHPGILIEPRRSEKTVTIVLPDHQRARSLDEQFIGPCGESAWRTRAVEQSDIQQGFATEEISSIQVDGETWRRLKGNFPESEKSRCREQISCFGPDGLLRRHDYTVDILGGATGLNYASDYRDVGGIMVPTKRRIYAYEGDYQRVKEPLLVGIDMGEITIQ